jgi:parallel beta-helix repeat protein
MRLVPWRRLSRASSSPPAPRRLTASFRPVLELLESRRVPATLYVSPSGSFHHHVAYKTIQAAVDHAASGDRIEVRPGTYQEQVHVTKNHLTLDSAVPLEAIIEAPQKTALTGKLAIVDIAGATDVTLERFTIEGPGPGNSGSLKYGVYVEGGGSATIASNHITRIHDNPLSGVQTGVGIQVGFNGTSSTSTTGSADILGNLIDNYQKSGIVVDHAGSSATIFDNQVLGTPNAIIAQNGIQISNGATGSVVGNHVTGNSYTGSKNVQGTGILLFNPGKDVAVLSNHVEFNDGGIGAQGAVDPVIRGNSLVQNTSDGIDLLAGTTGAVVAHNFAFNNGQDGIYVNADDNTVVGNVAFNNQMDGIELDAANHNTIRGNSATFNARYGISQTHGSSHNTLSRNHVADNGQGDFFP